jgi:hypothetical protein
VRQLTPSLNFPTTEDQMAKKTGMSETIAEGGHYIKTDAPRLPKGEFQQVGTYINEMSDAVTNHKGIGVKVNTGTMQTGEKI